MSGLLEKAKALVADKIANMPKPEATVTGVELKRFNRDSVLFHSEVSVNNPYSHSIPICEVSYCLKSAGREIVSGTIPDPGSLKPKGATKLDVPLKVRYDFLISLLRDIGKDWDIDYELQLGLIVDLPVVGDLTIPLSIKGEIKLPTLSDLI